MLLFLNTEFTNIIHPELISIGLVSNHSDTFYEESNEYKATNCSQYVKQEVLPLLSNSPLVSKDCFSISILLSFWLKQITPQKETIYIITDEKKDCLLFQQLLKQTTHESFFKFINIQEAIQLEILTFSKNTKIDNKKFLYLCNKTQLKFNLYFENWFILHKKKRHHSLNNATATQYGFINAIKDVLKEEFENKNLVPPIQ